MGDKACRQHCQHGFCVGFCEGVLRKDWRWQHAVERDTSLGGTRALTILLDVDGALMGDYVVIFDRSTGPSVR